MNFYYRNFISFFRSIFKVTGNSSWSIFSPRILLQQLQRLGKEWSIPSSLKALFRALSSLIQGLHLKFSKIVSLVSSCSLWGFLLSTPYVVKVITPIFVSGKSTPGILAWNWIVYILKVKKISKANFIDLILISSKNLRIICLILP